MKRHLIKKEDAKRAYEIKGGETQHTFNKAGKGRYVCVYMFVHLWFSGEAWVLSKHKHAGQRRLGEAEWSCREPHYTQQEPQSASSLLAVLTTTTAFYCTHTHTHTIAFT